MGNAATVFSILGKLAVSGSIAVCYNYTVELYPTTLRGTAVGLATVASMASNLVMPFTLQFKHFNLWLTSAFFGGFSFVAGILALFLPETAGKNLPSTIEEAEELYSNKLFLNISKKLLNMHKWLSKKTDN